MKILYIAPERGAAQAAVRSLRSIAPNVRLTWAQTPAAALAWLEGNPDAQAVIVDGASQMPGCTEVLRQVRGLGVPTPVAVISPDHLQALVAALKAGLDAVVNYDRSQNERLHAQLKEVQEWRDQTQRRLADRQAQHDAALARSGRICTALQEQLLGLEGSLRASEEGHAAKSAALERAGRLEAQLRAELVDASSSRTALERRLCDAEAAQYRAAADLAAAAERYALLDDRLGRETAARVAAEERLAAAELSRQDADRRHAADVAALTTRLGEEETQHRASLSRSTRICMALQARLLELESALGAAEERHAAYTSATERLKTRERDLSAALAEAIAVRTAIEHRLDEAESAHERARQRAGSELAASSKRHAALEHRLESEIDARKAIDEQLAAAETARHDAEQQHATALATLTARLADVQAQHDAAAERGAWLEGQLAEAAAALEQARSDWNAELAATTEQHAVEVATLTGRLADVQAQHDAAAERGAWLERQLAEANEQARIALDAGNREIARLQREGDAVRRQLDAMRTHAAALRRETERAPVLRRQLEESHKENRRQFERAPYGLFECTRDGDVTRANHSLARLVGYRNGADLQGAAFVETMFECPADLRWLLEQTAESGKPQSVQTTFKTRDRRRLPVCLHAVATDGPVVIAVEDLTRVAALEQRLREAQRLEAVGRVASEVAVTCGALLQDVTHGGRHWLARFETDAVLKLEGERLLADVTRAAGYLRQFVAYGNKQVSNLQPVSMRGVLRDLEPVLKRVLGADIVLVLPRTTDAFEVDLEVERVERILVTVANYARERMPRGGRVQIQLATTVVERRIVARYPMVRPGPHVLITITEVQDSARPASVSPAGRTEMLPAVSEKPAMDLGPLVALIAGAGGHLWMSAEPAGDMTLQIHLPKRVQDAAAEQDAVASWSNRGRQLARWFRH